MGFKFGVPKVIKPREVKKEPDGLFKGSLKLNFEGNYYKYDDGTYGRIFKKNTQSIFETIAQQEYERATRN